MNEPRQNHDKEYSDACESRFFELIHEKAVEWCKEQRKKNNLDRCNNLDDIERAFEAGVMAMFNGKIRE